MLEIVLACLVVAQEPRTAQAFASRAAIAMDKAKSDPSLDRAHRLAVVTDGIADADRALGLEPQNMTALVYKNLLLRYEAALVDDRERQDALIREAGAVRDKARSLRPPAGDSAPEPSPPDEFDAAVKRVNAVRGSGAVQLPRKVIDVRPAFPKVRTTGGPVVLDLLVDSSGQVGYVCVRRAPDGLDPAVRGAILKAVSDWKYLPLLLDNQFRSFVVTVTVTIDVLDNEATK